MFLLPDRLDAPPFVIELTEAELDALREAMREADVQDVEGAESDGGADDGADDND